MIKTFKVFQILGAGITVTGAVLLITIGISQLGLLPIAKIGIDTAIMSLLMATNGYMVLIFGMMTGGNATRDAKPVAAAVH